LGSVTLLTFLLLFRLNEYPYKRKVRLSLRPATEAAAVTVSPIVVVRIKLPDVPVIVTVDVPTTAELDAASVTKAVPATLPALKDAVTPPGRPDAARLTLPLKPFCALPVIVLAPLLPCVRLTLAGDTESVKLVGGVIVSAIVAVLFNALETPVTITIDVPSQPKG
jgi:hypothetical protein